jgi:hypothetical protein
MFSGPRSSCNAQSKLDKQRLAFAVVSDNLFWRGDGVARSKSPAAFASKHRITALFFLTFTKEFYEYCADHTINLSPPSDLVGRWTTTVGGAVDRLGANAALKDNDSGIK